jgi:hypothetical protein
VAEVAPPFPSPWHDEADVTEQRSKTSYPQWDDLPIEFLVHATQDYVVFLDADLDIDWRTSDVYDEAKRFPEGWGNIQNRLAALEGTISDDVPVRSKRAFRRMLAEGLARGLEGETDEAAKILDEAEKFASARNRELGRLVHMRTAASTTALVLLPSVTVGLMRETLGKLLGQTPVLLIMCGGAGSLGALFSVLRNMGTAPDPEADSRLQRTEAVARILVGGFGAVLAVLAVRSGIVLPQLGTAAKGIAGLILVSVVAGTSERLVPDLIRRLEGANEQPPARLPTAPATTSSGATAMPATISPPPASGSSERPPPPGLPPVK